MPAGETRVGFLGAGKMATALARGWLAAGLVKPQHCRASDPHLPARVEFARQTGAVADTDNVATVMEADVVVLAVKPQVMPDVLAEVAGLVRPEQIVISIAAGITLEALAAAFGPAARLVRVMPNTPCMVMASASGYSVGGAATAEDVARVELLLNAVGRAFRLPERLLDAVTGLSGSGPAFVYLAIEALSDGGVRAGLPRDVATTLAAQTVLGAAKMVLETGLHPGQLKDQVTSPGGTTIAGLHALEKGGARAALIDAVVAAAGRSVELGRVT